MHNPFLFTREVLRTSLENDHDRRKDQDRTIAQ